MHKSQTLRVCTARLPLSNGLRSSPYLHGTCTMVFSLFPKFTKLTLPWDFLICLSGIFSAQFTLGDAFMTPPPSKTHTGPHCSLVPYLALFFFMVFYSTSNHSVFCLLVNCISLQIECKFHEGRRFICHVHCAAFVTGPVPRNFLFCTGL